jgi:hypothetical protein
MPDVNDVFGGETIKAADLMTKDVPPQAREFTLAIGSVQAKEFDKGNKLVIKFVGAKKALIANRTNAKRIALLYGNNTDFWVGRRITLYPEMVDFKGEPTWAVRVKAPPAEQQMPVAAQQPAPPQVQPHPQYIDDPMPPLDRNSSGDVPF